MPKNCSNGITCKFLKTPKGCKFAHPLPANDKESLAPAMYSEIMAALQQANCTAQGHSKNLGGRITALLLDHYTYDELGKIVVSPSEFAEQIYTALEVIEDCDHAFYVPVS